MWELASLTFRVGIGFDSHKLDNGESLVIGGVNIPHTKGLIGHSDGDVLVHAIMDCLLGASGLGDKGSHFPSSDPELRDISSLVLLSKVVDLLDVNRWRITNVDATIIAQKPRLSHFLKDMIELTSKTLLITPEQLSIKVTTTDYMGFIGREEGIAACAVAAIEKNS
tara:strand:- start:318 stop:818 length:501 start_codon:yes stop_codon:yes gene_type:complete